MASTAEKQQSAAIRQRMQEIRCELPQHMNDARRDVKGYLDWRYHVRKHPFVAASLVAAVSYMLVPEKQAPPPKRNRLHHLLGGKSNEETEEEVQKKTFISGVLSSLLTLGLRSALTFATRQAATHFTGSLQRSLHPGSVEREAQPVPLQRGNYR